MVDGLTVWVTSAPVGLALAAIAVAAALEYLVPPLPGDTLVAFGVFLAARAALGALPVLAAATAGAVAGSLVAYAFGRWVSGVPRDRWPGMLRRPGVAGPIDGALRRFADRPRLWLLANRFLPALRAVFFVAAGIRRVPVGDVLLFGGLSAAIWNAGILALAYPAGRRWDDLRGLLDGYARIAFAVVLVTAVIGWWRWRRSRRPSDAA